MPFTRNINYTQNVPVSLGFVVSHFNPSPSRTVTARFVLDQYYPCGGQMGYVSIPDDPALTIQSGRSAVNSSGSASLVITGPVANVNAALAAATWVSRAYDIEDVDQDVMALDRSVGNYQGEMQIQLPANVDTTALVVGNQLRFSTIPGTGTSYQFTITKVDFTNIPVRVWCIFNRDYNLADLHLANTYKTVKITTSTTSTCFAQTVGGVNIGPVIDMSFSNAQGYISILFREEDGGTVDNIINLNGSPLMAEPVFTTSPATSTSASSTNTWYNLSSIGQISQADNNFQSIQILVKALENDPNYLDVTDYTSLPGYPSSGTDIQKAQFIGDAIDAKASLCIPKYITDNSYGTFGDGQVNDRASVSTTATGHVRWSYYDTPAGINANASRVYYYRPAGFIKDFKIEVRIVNGRTRIYSSRGK